MMFDILHKFTADQTINQTDTHEHSDYNIDSGYANPNLGKAGQIGAMMIVKTPDATMTSVEFQIWEGDSACNERMLCSSGPILLATAVKGYTVFVPYPRDVKRYREALFVIVGTSAALVVDAYECVLQ